VTSSPTLGVIVTAFDRRTYFAQAVESVLGADVGPNFTEYLLVRNFEDAVVDPELVKRGVRIVPDTSPDVGGTLYCALDHCDAEYLAFVDDDDLVLSHRWKRFEEIRALVPDLTYYHNAYEMFSDPASVTPSRSGNVSARAAPSGRPWSRWRVADGEPFLRFLADKSWERNISSTIVHRRVLERARDELSAIPAMSDTATLIAAITSPGSLVFDHEVTTRVRRHQRNVSKTTRNTRQRDLSLDLFARLVARSSGADVARDYLELRRAREAVYNCTFGRARSPAELRAAMRILQRYWKRLRRWRDIGFIGLGAVALAAPAALPALRPLLVPR